MGEKEEVEVKKDTRSSKDSRILSKKRSTKFYENCDEVVVFVKIKKQRYTLFWRVEELI